jgi:hypothetical protein
VNRDILRELNVRHSRRAVVGVMCQLGVCLEIALCMMDAMLVSLRVITT